MPSERRFYVYVLKDDAGRPFYVGKGSGSRAMHHVLRRGAAHNGKARREMIDAIIAAGRGITIDLASWHATEVEALAAETAMIAKIGVAGDGTGPLTNVRRTTTRPAPRDGGSFRVNTQVSDETFGRIKAQAAAERRTVNSQMVVILERQIAQMGPL